MPAFLAKALPALLTLGLWLPAAQAQKAITGMREVAIGMTLPTTGSLAPQASRIREGATACVRMVVYSGSGVFRESRFGIITHVRGTFAGLSRGVAFSSVVPNPFDVNVSLSHEYQVAMKAAGFKSILLTGMEAYANMKVLGEALRRSGRHPDRASLRQALAFPAPVELGGVTLQPAPAQGLNAIDVFMLTHGGRLIR